MHVVVVGGGITGLVAALRLRQADDPPTVTLLEASDRLGGKILTTPFAGLPAVDAGADAFLARVPWASALCAELGLTDLTSPATGKASVWWNGALHPIPDGLVLGVPAGLGGLARSHLLSWPGKARAAVEPLLPRRPDDDNVGTLIRRRFGAEVLERLVDPLVGSINAGDADRLSLAASVPQLAEAAARSRSLLLGLRNRPAAATTGPVFLTPVGGVGALVDAVVARLGGVDIRCGSPGGVIERGGATRWRVAGIDADAVILAVPAYAAADALAAVAPTAATGLAAVEYASVAMVTLALPADGVTARLDGSGYLVPKPAQRHITACSWGSSKWTHWARPGQVVLRASLGRAGDTHAVELDDDALVHAALADLRVHLGVRADPTAVRVTRWPRSFPQYLPGHLDRVAAIDAAVASEAPGVVLAGAAYRGVGIPACIRQGGEAAAATLIRDSPGYV